MTCTIDDCTRPILVKSRGLCDAHYRRWQRWGDPLAGRSTMVGDTWKVLVDALASDTDQCISWPFAHDGNGRPQISVNGHMRSTCRIICQIVHGPPPSSSRKYEAAHNCGKGHEGCINPRHLRWATSAGNQADRNIHGTIQCNNRSGVTGVSWLAARKKWQAQIQVESKHRFLGYFDNLEDAAKARRDAEESVRAILGRNIA